MSGIKVVRNHVPGSSDVVVSAVLKWISGVIGAAVAVLLVAAVLGQIANNGTTAKNTVALNDLATQVKVLVEANEKQWEQARKEREELKIGQNALKVRLTAIDKKIE